jgi:hypothetical protein
MPLQLNIFEAGDKSRVSVLKPLDIVTTAGSAGNIAALQTCREHKPWAKTADCCSWWRSQ